MRIAAAIWLVIALGGAEIDRAQQVARSREAERAEFHRRYLFELKDDTVTQIEVVTEFRRLVLITEEHLRLGDQMFSRGTRLAEAALAPTRGLVTFKARLRFHPLNTYSTIPDFKIALGPASSASTAAPAALEGLDTEVTGEYSQPYKGRSGKNVKTLLGATLQADILASRVGPTRHPLGVVFDGKEIARTVVDFEHLD
jgi:hypothetical protein